MTSTGENAVLRLWIKDSGLGFDHRTIRSQIREDSELMAYGRGMPLIERIVSELQYLGNGNHVLVEYPL